MAVLLLGVGLPCGCASLPSILIDPDAIGSDQGTLISTSDLRSVSQAMLESMSQSPALAALHRRGRPIVVSMGEIKNRTTIAIFDKQLFTNRLRSDLSAADTEGRFKLLDRSAAVVPGQAAELALGGEIREILSREPLPDGRVRETRAIQYTLTLTRIEDTAILWSSSYEVVKSQTQGALYQ